MSGRPCVACGSTANVTSSGECADCLSPRVLHCTCPAPGCPKHRRQDMDPSPELGSYVSSISPRAFMLTLRCAARQSADEGRSVDLVATFDDLVADGVIVPVGGSFALATEVLH